MMQRDPFGERVVCFICNYGLILLAILAIAGVAAWRLAPTLAAAPFPWVSTPTATATLTPIPSPTPLPPTVTPTQSATITPVANTKPEFILVFVPIAWTTDQAHFEQAANEQADNFMEASQIGDFFQVRVVILDDGPIDPDLTDSNLDYTVLEYGLSHYPGDRYIGLTDSNLAPGGERNVVGWTSGGQSMVAESFDAYVTAHELGHTFGLCDEYNYSAWSMQQQSYTDGCPNPYPTTCSKSMEPGVNCDGTPTEDGNNSIMGPAGLQGGHGYNTACLEHLREQFELLSSRVMP